jgi:hypothetical protein
MVRYRLDRTIQVYLGLIELTKYLVVQVVPPGTVLVVHQVLTKQLTYKSVI